jgi:hypothetical protein
MDWYYAEGQERRGPVSAEQLQTLIAAGTVTADTRVWNSTLTDWRPLRETTLAGTGVGTDQRCIITGKNFPPSQMIQTEHGWVSAEGRDTYYQCLREGVPFPVPQGMFNARADGKRVVVPVGNAVLPRRCIKTNRPVTEEEVKRKMLYWCTPWVYLALLLNLLVVLILYLVLRKKVPLDIPLSGEGRRLQRKRALIACGVAVLGIVCVMLPIWNDQLIGLILLGIVLVLGACIYANIKATLLRPVKLKNGEVWLAGACPEFIASLPAYGTK